MFRRRTNTTRKSPRRKRKSATLRTSRIEQLEDRRMLAAFDLSETVNLPETESNQIIDEVVIDGDTMVIETNDIDTRTWAVSVYNRNDQGTPLDQADDSWDFENTLIEEPYSLYASIFISLAVSNNVVAVGYDVTYSYPPCNNCGAPLPPWSLPSKGRVYVFDGTSGWDSVIETTLKPSVGHKGDNFGRSLAISGTTIVVGASGNIGGRIRDPFVFENNDGDLFVSDGSLIRFSYDGTYGAAYVYDGSAGWENAVETKLTVFYSTSRDEFGSSVSIAGNNLVVGAPGADNSTGAVYLYNRSEGWGNLTETKLTPSYSIEGDRFGASVDIVGTTVLVGAPQNGRIRLATEDGDTLYSWPRYSYASGTGKVYTFDLSSDLENFQETELVPPTNTDLTRFGEKVELVGTPENLTANISGYTSGQQTNFEYQLSEYHLLIDLLDLSDTDPTYPSKTGSIESDIGTLNQLAVDSIPFFVATMSDPQDGGRTAVTSRKTLSALNVHREITVPNSWNVDYARTVDVFSNITGVKLDTTVTYTSSLASGTNTSVFMTSDGDTILEPTDLWVGTYDANDPESTSMIHWLRGSSGAMPRRVALVDGELQWEYDITVPAGEEVRLGVFNMTAAGTSETIAAAKSLIQLTGFSEHADDYLTADEKASLVNFQFLDRPKFLTELNENPGLNIVLPIVGSHEWSDLFLKLSVKIPNEIYPHVSQLKFTLNVNESTTDLDFENIELFASVDSIDIETLPGKVLFTVTLNSNTDDASSYFNDRLFIASIPVAFPISTDVIGEYPEFNRFDLPSISHSKVYLDQVVNSLDGTNTVTGFIRTVNVVSYDMNDDDKIGLADLSLFLNLLGENTNDNPLAFRADFDRNGIVDLLDLLEFTKNFGKEKGDGQSISLPWDRFEVLNVPEYPIPPNIICPPFPRYPIDTIDIADINWLFIPQPGPTQSGSTDAANDNAGLSFSSGTSFTSGQITTGEVFDAPAVELSLSDVESVLAFQSLVSEDHDLLALLAESQAAGEISYASEDQQAIDDLFAEWGL